MRYPLLSKATALVSVVLGLVWGLSAVSHVVEERAGRLREAQRSVADSLASSQTVVGPVLGRACTETWPVQQGSGKETRTVSERRDFSVHAAPNKLVMAGQATTEARYRGIFKVNGYALSAELTADWSDLAALQPRPTHEGGSVACAAPFLMLAVSDPRGVRHAVLRVQDQPVAVAPGTLHKAHARGLHALLPEALIQPSLKGGVPLHATLKLDLVGTQSLAVAPIADDNEVRLASDWPHPSFGGRFLPGSRSIDARGFTATWQISALATTAREAFLAGQGVCPPRETPLLDSNLPDAPTEVQTGTANCIETFGTSFMDPVNPYVLNDRAAKYGLLFIVLTFVAVGLVEVMRSLRVHPVQYLLVGSALVVFFLLLVSLSEQWSFGQAYATAAAASTLLLGYYGMHVLRGLWPGLAFGAGIAALFGALYVLLQLEQGSLVLGSVLLFLVLAGVMVVTRKLDWYALQAQWRMERSA